jgi:hypothetical protein
MASKIEIFNKNTEKVYGHFPSPTDKDKLEQLDLLLSLA